MSRAKHHAIIDIGSNTIRLVVFDANSRAPKVLYDDKLAARLGRGVVAHGKLEGAGLNQALTTLKRYAALVRLLQPASLQVVATAAVRDAANGNDFLEKVRALGLPARLLSGEEEAEASAWGVIASHPAARGLMADLGGGSLELARIADGRVGSRVSFPLGVMPIAAIRAQGRGRLRRTLADALAPLDWLDTVVGEELYLVGGAWRALDRVRTHHFGGERGSAYPAGLTRQIKALVRELGPRRLSAIPGVSSARAMQLDHAAALLRALVGETRVAKVVASDTGLREGLLFRSAEQFST